MMGRMQEGSKDYKAKIMSFIYFIVHVPETLTSKVEARIKEAI